AAGDPRPQHLQPGAGPARPRDPPARGVLPRPRGRGGCRLRGRLLARPGRPPPGPGGPGRGVPGGQARAPRLRAGDGRAAGPMTGAPPTQVSVRDGAAAPADRGADLSIVVVSWNTRDELRSCLRSSFDGLGGIAGEVIVVDNASADGSADMVAAEFPAARLVRNDDNLGFAGGCNRGIAVATGRHVLLLNPDTVVMGDV